MSVEDARPRVIELSRILREHNRRYYVLDQPLVDDAEYDLLYQEILELERIYPELVVSDSPTQRVGAEPSNQFQKAEHLSPMLSMANAFSSVCFDPFWRNSENSRCRSALG